MLNEEMRTVTMSRDDMYRIATALTGIMYEFAGIDRKDGSFDMWKRIKQDFCDQLEAQDPEEYKWNPPTR